MQQAENEKELQIAVAVASSSDHNARLALILLLLFLLFQLQLSSTYYSIRPWCQTAPLNALIAGSQLPAPLNKPTSISTPGMPCQHVWIQRMSTRTSRGVGPVWKLSIGQHRSNRAKSYGYWIIRAKTAFLLCFQMICYFKSPSTEETNSHINDCFHL